MGEDQWFQPTVRNRVSKAIILKNFEIAYGKFYDINDPFVETGSPQGTRIANDGEYEWGHSGRQSSPTGTEGSFEIYLEEGDEKIGRVAWDCPYIGSNKLTKHDLKQGYDISFDGFSDSTGPLGKGKINVRKD